MVAAAGASAAVMAGMLLGAVVLDQRNNPLERSRSFLRRRLLNWAVCGLLYASFYMARYNYSIINTPEVRAAFGVGKQTFGVLYIAGQWTYGVSQVAAGLLSDHIGGKRAILYGAVGVAATALVNTLLFMSGMHVFAVLVMLNIVNNIFQPLGSLSTLKINSGWFHKQERGVFSGVFGCMISFGYYLALVVGGLMLGHLPWWWQFGAPTLLLAVFAVAVGFVVCDMPEDAGHSIPSEVRAVEKVAHTRPTTSRQRLAKVFANRRIRVAGVAMFFVGWARGSFLDWQGSYYTEHIGIEAGSGMFTLATSCISVGGILGSMVGGFLSDRCFTSKRAPVVLAYFVLEIVGFVLYLVVEVEAVQVLLAGFVTFALFGTLTLLMASAPADYAGHELAGTASAVMNFGQYVGSGIASFASGFLIDSLGWRAWLASMIPVAALGAICMVVLLRSPTVGDTQRAPQLELAAKPPTAPNDVALAIATGDSGDDDDDVDTEALL